MQHHKKRRRKISGQRSHQPLQRFHSANGAPDYHNIPLCHGLTVLVRLVKMPVLFFLMSKIPMS
jgi:hypothetical protein